MLSSCISKIRPFFGGQLMTFQEFLTPGKYTTTYIGAVTSSYRNISQSKIPNQSLPQEAQDEAIKNIPETTNVLETSLNHPDFFSVRNLFNIEKLFKANVHLGHREGSLNNYMKPYIFGSRLGHLIIDLDKSAILLREALNFTAHIAFNNGVIVFICRGAQHQLLVEKTAEECFEFSHTRPWKEGLFTDSVSNFREEIRLPDLLIFLNTRNDPINEHLAVQEAARMGIPSVGVVDTNCDPRLITYPVPGNDDTFQSISLYCDLFKSVILTAKEKRKQFKLDT